MAQNTVSGVATATMKMVISTFESMPSMLHPVDKNVAATNADRFVMTLPTHPVIFCNSDNALDPDDRAVIAMAVNNDRHVWWLLLEFRYQVFDFHSRPRCCKVTMRTGTIGRKIHHHDHEASTVPPSFITRKTSSQGKAKVDVVQFTSDMSASFVDFRPDFH